MPERPPRGATPDAPRATAPDTIATEAEPAPPGPVKFVPTGPEDRSVLFARVVAVDFLGKITVESERGPTEVWVVDPRQYRFGDRVRIETTIRSVKLEPQPAGAPPQQLAPPLVSEPGDHAIVIGRVTGGDARGMITVDSERGPIRVWVRREEPARHPVGTWVEVRTRVLPAP